MSARGMSCAYFSLSDEILLLAGPLLLPPALLFAQLVCWYAVCVVDVPRRRVSTGPALACVTRRRCRTALFALRATATSDPFSAVLLFCRTKTASRPSRRTAAPPAVHSPAWWASHLFAKAGCFLLLRAALLAVLLPSCRGALSCACGARGKLRCSVRLCAVCLRLLHSALGVVARRTAL